MIKNPLNFPRILISKTNFFFKASESVVMFYILIKHAKISQSQSLFEWAEWFDWLVEKSQKLLKMSKTQSYQKVKRAERSVNLNGEEMHFLRPKPNSVFKGKKAFQSGRIGGS